MLTILILALAMSLSPRDECKQQCSRTAIDCDESATSYEARQVCRREYNKCVAGCAREES